MGEEKFDKIFKDKLENYTPEVESSLKEGVLSSLDQPSGGIGGAKIMSYSAVVAVMLGISAWFVSPSEITTKQDTQNNQIILNEQAEVISIQRSDQSDKVNQRVFSEARKPELVEKNDGTVKSSTSDGYSYPGKPRSKVEIPQKESDGYSYSNEIYKTDESDGVEDGFDQQELPYIERVEFGGGNTLPKSLVISGNSNRSNQISNGLKSNATVPTARKIIPLYVFSELHALVSYSHIDVNTSDNILVSEVSTQPALSFDRIGLRYHLGIGTSLSTKWRVYLAFSGQLENYKLNYFTQSTNLESGASMGQVSDLGISYDLDSMEQQVDIKRINLGLTFGSIYDYLQVRKVTNSINIYASYFTNYGADSDLLREDQLYLTLGHRSEFRLSKRLSMVLEPSISYTLLNNQTDYHVYLKPFSLGVGAGLMYRFHLKRNK